MGASVADSGEGIVATIAGLVGAAGAPAAPRGRRNGRTQWVKHLRQDRSGVGRAGDPVSGWIQAGAPLVNAPRSVWRGAAVAALMVYMAPGFAIAQEVGKNGGADLCDRLSWSLARERAWFNDAKLPHRPSGVRLRKIDRAVDLALLPTTKVQFFLPPTQPPRPDSFSGAVTFFGVPKPGVYQVTLSRAATIDVFENGVRLKKRAATGAPTCQGVAESERFELAPGDLVLVELSDATTNSIKVAFARAK